ncbi:carboxylesterase family protein [Mangrovibacterium diazotrophicum]|uniref:Putative esterase n=1 Tax=Mangrovibacterium diazotrophicum TaxID=1261403 RepID=A0A419W719_9BACT|nr:alpha/beta hydrolase-fold protein [Mangrovibacterium diazotrophicum]RKD91245.1 putative esterase [Mangrovibacterium diazotrophicum]
MKISTLRTFFLIAIALVFHLSSSAADPELKKVHYNYLTYLPENYDSTQANLYPVIIYLHGRSVSGTDLNRVRRYGLPYFLDHGKKMDFIVVAPQCPWGKRWSSENWLDSMMVELNTKYRIDNDRIYLTGMSLGGFGTWELANMYPNRFAAIAPMCGGGNTSWADNIYHIPTWVFHGVQDRLVPVLRSDQMVKALEAHHALVKYDRLTKKGHDLSRLFDDNEIYSWFAQFTRRPLNEEDEKSLKPLEPIWVTEVEPLDKITHPDFTETPEGGVF